MDAEPNQATVASAEASTEAEPAVPTTMSTTESIVVQLGDLSSRTVGSHKTRLLDHPLCLALVQQDSELFANFVATCKKRQRRKPTAQWTGLLALRDSVRQHGLRITAEDPIVFKRKARQQDAGTQVDTGSKKEDASRVWYCSHGRHRMCAAAALFGPCAQVRLQVISDVLAHVVEVTGAAAVSPDLEMPYCEESLAETVPG